MYTVPVFHPLPPVRPFTSYCPCHRRLCFLSSPQSPVPQHPETVDSLPHPHQSHSLSSRGPRATSSPHPLASDSITIALKSNHVLVIIADCWSSETECRSIFLHLHIYILPPSCHLQHLSLPDPSSFLRLLRLQDGSTMQQGHSGSSREREPAFLMPYTHQHKLVSLANNQPCRTSLVLKCRIFILTPR